MLSEREEVDALTEVLGRHEISDSINGRWCSCGEWDRLVSPDTTLADHIAAVVLGSPWLDAYAERVRAEERERLADHWRALPVWGPNPQGLHILDDVDIEGLMADLGQPYPPSPRDASATE